MGVDSCTKIYQTKHFSVIKTVYMTSAVRGVFSVALSVESLIDVSMILTDCIVINKTI